MQENKENIQTNTIADPNAPKIIKTDEGALDGQNKCPKCGAEIRPHRVCPECGSYKGKEVVKTSEETTK